MAAAELTTDRLRLRDWCDDDLEPFIAMGSDPEVMRYFPSQLTREQSIEFAWRVRTAFESQGWGLWAVEVRGGAAFIGFVGLNWARFDAHFTPALEVGWRLAREAWGFGYATEAARASLRFGFQTLGIDEIVSLTAAVNTRSRRVMERLGMTRTAADDFEHPAVADAWLRPHVLYRVTRAGHTDGEHR